MRRIASAAIAALLPLALSACASRTIAQTATSATSAASASAPTAPTTTPAVASSPGYTATIPERTAVIRSTGTEGDSQVQWLRYPEHTAVHSPGQLASELGLLGV